MTTESESFPRQQRAENFFKYGNDAALKNNFDYAVQMYQDACRLAPENLTYRQALRGIERRKFNNDPAKVGRLVGARTQPIKLRVGASKAKKDWKNVIEHCEEVFVHNPWDVAASRDLAEAAEHLGLKQLARFAMEAVYHQALNDVHFQRHIAHVYEINEDWQRAIDCWEKVRQLAPTDEEAKRKINGLAANATISRSGLGNAIKQRDEIGVPSEKLAAELNELKAQVLTPEERMLKEIEDEPDRVGPYLELAEHYQMHNRLDEAEKILARGLATNPNETVLQSAHAEVQVARLQRAIRAWSKRAAEFPDDADARAKLAQLQEKLNSYELKEFRRRLSLHPEDMTIRYEIGLRLAAVGKVDEAIAEFQQARNAAPLKVKALQQLGAAFEAKGLPKLAERNYLDALKGIEPEETALANALNYQLGLVYEKMGNFAKAEEHFNEVAANDYGFRDVARRLADLSERTGG